LHKFVLADGLYAVPGVSLLFVLGFWFGDSILGLIHEIEQVKYWVVIGVLGLLALYLAYRFLRKPVVTGAPEEMPPVVGPVADKVEQALEQVASKTLSKMKITRCPPDVPPPCPGQEIVEEVDVPAGQSAPDGNQQAGNAVSAPPQAAPPGERGTSVP
jgi:hypothetical protein